jgi:hypothetical protein
MLFRSLREQGVEEGYVYLLNLLYKQQQGILGDQYTLEINRGVRQGDVLSPALFNVTLEQALQRWKRQLTTHGLALVPDEQAERMTNIRFADDIMIIGKSLEEVVEMLELLIEILSEYGLDLNIGKTMILTTDNPPTTKTLAAVEEGFVEILSCHKVHKYLGRAFSGDLRERGRSALDHRLRCGWAKFQALQLTLTDKHVPLKLRLKMFDNVVTPTVLYALGTAPLSDALKQKLDITQRCMLRRMLGWVCYDNDSWEERGRRMKLRLEKALELYPVEAWSVKLQTQKANFVEAINTMPKWTRLAYEWKPLACDRLNGVKAHRRRGRPRTRCV